MIRGQLDQARIRQIADKLLDATRVDKQEDWDHAAYAHTIAALNSVMAALIAKWCDTDHGGLQDLRNNYEIQVKLFRDNRAKLLGQSGALN